MSGNENKLNDLTGRLETLIDKNSNVKSSYQIGEDGENFVLSSLESAFPNNTGENEPILGCDTFGPEPIWSPDTFGPKRQLVPVHLVPKDSRSPRQLVPMDEWSPSHLVPVDKWSPNYYYHS